MRVLFITPSPPNDLNRIRSKNIIKSLHRLGHKITLISLYKNKKEKQTLGNSSEYCHKVIGIYQPIWLSLINCFIGIFSSRPLQVAYCYSFLLRRELRKAEHKTNDFIYIKRLRMAQYADLFNEQKTFVDITDCMTKYYKTVSVVAKGLKRVLAIEEYFKHSSYEPKICKGLNIVICSDSDKNYLVNHYNVSDSNITILENGIDFSTWRLDDDDIQIVDRCKLFFWGVMNVETNELSCKSFIQKVMPLLDDRFTFTIIGPKPSTGLLKLNSDTVRFIGHVQNIQSFMGSRGIFICPMIAGAGVKNKILQAAAIGLPIISTSLGAEGLNEQLRRCLFIADSPHQFRDVIEHIVRMTDNELNSLLISQRDVARRHYDILTLVKKFMINNLET